MNKIFCPKCKTERLFEAKNYAVKYKNRNNEDKISVVRDVKICEVCRHTLVNKQHGTSILNKIAKIDEYKDDVREIE